MAHFTVMRNDKNVNACPALAFLTDPNIAWAENKLIPIATIDEAGTNFTLLRELFKIKDGEGNTVDVEETSRGFQFKVTVIGLDKYNMRILQEGTETDAVAVSAKAFTNQLVRFSDKNITYLPFANVKITSITSTDSTPVAYALTDVEIMNDNAGINTGAIKLSDNTTIPVDKESGTEVYINGTHKVNATTKRSIGDCSNNTTNFYGLRLRIQKKSGANDIYDVWKVKLVEQPGVISTKGGEVHKAELTFEALKDFSKGNYGEQVYEENA